MATRKQKHQAMLEKRALFEEEVRQTGLEAQRKDRKRRAQQIDWTSEVSHRQNKAPVKRRGPLPKEDV